MNLPIPSATPSSVWSHFRNGLCICFSMLLFSQQVSADTASASLAMEDPSNPLLLISTSAGSIYIELLPREAPRNVANLIALTNGEAELIAPNTGSTSQRRYYNGLRFHRVIEEVLIQSGSPVNHPAGRPEQELADEINADALGLDQMPVLNADGSFNSVLNIGSEADFQKEILEPLYARMDIDSEAELLDKQEQVLQQLQAMTVKRAYENLGYRYSSSSATRAIERGIVALANRGANSNGPEFFISVASAPWLTGKHTVVGHVVEGIEVADSVASTAVDPTQYSRLSTLVYSIRIVN